MASQLTNSALLGLHLKFAEGIEALDKKDKNLVKAHCAVYVIDVHVHVCVNYLYAKYLQQDCLSKAQHQLINTMTDIQESEMKLVDLSQQENHLTQQRMEVLYNDSRCSISCVNIIKAFMLQLIRDYRNILAEKQDLFLPLKTTVRMVLCTLYTILLLAVYRG